MTGILTKKFNVSLVDSFINDVKTSNNNYYVFVGKSTPWANDSAPPAANLAFSNYDHDVYDNLLYGKKITNNDIKALIPRNTWTNNTLYAEYNKDDSDLYSKQFFVYNSAASIKSVFKVIQAGSGNSVVAPAIISTSPFKTSDGYVWKYMFTVSDSDMSKFGSNTYIPVTPNTSITSTAIPGGIDAIKVTASGTGWVTFNTGILQSTINATAVVISSNASSNNDFYVGSSIYFKSGLGSSQIRDVADYDGTSKQLILSEPLNIKTNISLANISGAFAVNDILTQNLIAISISSQSGYIQPGDTITQSNTGATATIITANSSYFRVKPLTSTEFINNLAIDAGRGTTLGFNKVTTSNTTNTVTAAINTRTFNASTAVDANGRIAISTNPFTVNERITYTVAAGNTVIAGLANGSSYFIESSNSTHIYLTATLGGSKITLTPGLSQTGHTFTSNANFISFYPQGSYIKVNTHFHRVVSVTNNNSLSVSGPFGDTYTSNIHYKVVSAATVSSTSNISANGIIEFADLNGTTLTISSVAGSFDLGEIVTQPDSSTNGVVAFSNSSSLILTNITGSFVTGNTIVGVTSNSSANVTTVTSNPTLTLSNTSGSFILGAPVLSSSAGTANIITISLLPNEQTEYIISPKITIDGDGSNAAAYSIVNTTSKSIDSIVVFDPGTNYTQANVTISANPSYGNSAILTALIAPVSGHGSNAALELGAIYSGISVTFGNTYTESFNLPGSGQFRTVGIIQNPLFDNVYLTIANYDRVKINLTGANTFDIGEVVYQANLATGIVVYQPNTNYIELKAVRGTFDKTAANLTIIGLSSEKTSTISNVNISEFTVVSNSFVVQETSEAAGNLVSSNTTTLRVTSASGTFLNGSTVYDTYSNAYANVTSVKTANNTKTLTFDYFNQLARVSLSQSTGTFSNNEQVEMRTSIGTKIGSARIYDRTNDIDLIISSNTAAFTMNERIDQSTSANGILIGANSTHLKLTNVKGTFSASANISGFTSGANAVVSSVNKVITLADVDGVLTESTNNYFIGLTSDAIGYAESPNTIIRPNLVRDTGSVLYIENIEPVTRTDVSIETAKLVIKF